MRAAYLIVEKVIQLQEAMLIRRIMFVDISQKLDLIQALIHVVLVVLQ